jgi:lipopolysaccharide/colanic/teichoic acid biosynthesis glycosyltransferase
MKSHNFSIFLKDMAIIGPRPERPFRKEIMVPMPSMTLDMLLSRQTGWAQVNYAYGANIDDMIKLQYDPYYITVSISI